MAKRVFTEVPHEYGDGKRGFHLMQTRNGVEEAVTLVASVGLDSKDNLYKPMELYGATVADRPAANSVAMGAVFMAVNTREIWQSNTIEWVYWGVM